MKLKKFAVFFAILFLMAGIVYAKEFQLTKRLGEYTVEITNDKNPAVVGENNLKIVIKDQAGNFVPDAKVAVEYSMPAMPGMPPMNYKANAELKGNQYLAKMDIPVSGSWNVGVKISRAGKAGTIKFSVDAH